MIRFWICILFHSKYGREKIFSLLVLGHTRSTSPPTRERSMFIFCVIHHHVQAFWILLIHTMDWEGEEWNEDEKYQRNYLLLLLGQENGRNVLANGINGLANDLLEIKWIKSEPDGFITVVPFDLSHRITRRASSSSLNSSHSERPPILVINIFPRCPACSPVHIPDKPPIIVIMCVHSKVYHNALWAFACLFKASEDSLC